MPVKRYQLTFLILTSFLTLFLLVKKETHAAWFVNSYGDLVNESGEVLGAVYAKGDDDDGDKGGGSGSGGGGGGSSSGGSSSGSGGGESSGKDDKKEGKKEEKKDEGKSGSSGGSGKITTKSTNIPPTAVPTVEQVPTFTELDEDEDEEEEVEDLGVKTKTEEGKTEIIFGEGEKIKTRTKDGETRTDIYSGGVKVRIEQKEGRLVIKAENEAGEEIGLGEQELFKIEERLDKNIVKVATGSGNSLVFSRGAFAAKTNFPLSVDLATNALVVTTPAGIKTVTILPDAAVQNMLAANVIDRLGTAAVLEALEATGSGRLTGVAGVVELGLRNNVPVYEIAGLSDQRLLGFIPVSIPQKVIVSAETGELVETQKPLFSTLLDFFSF